MNKSEFIAKIAEKSGLEKSNAGKFLDSFVETVKEVISSGEKIQLVGFGTFEAKNRPEMDAINPATGEKIKVPACKVPSFKVSKSLKEEINK